MSDENDKESKTEFPSEKRIKDAVEKGNVPFSPEAGILSSLAALMVVCLMMAASSVEELTQHLSTIIENSALLDLSGGNDAFQLVLHEVWAVFMVCLPVLSVFCIGGVIGPLAQNSPQANLERLMPKPERISPVSNIKRLFGKQAFIDFGKMIVKVLAVSTITYWAMKSQIANLFRASTTDVSAVPGLVLAIVQAVVSPLCLVALLIAVVDQVIVRLKWFDDLKMTKHEMKDEHKQTEGDPAIKERARATARQRLKSRMMADLPRATLVITNPTHFAVALRYVPSEGGAPLVIAKGMDHLALRIRSFSEENGIAVVENKPLARSLFGMADVGSMIPPEFYRAVAEIIHFVDMKNRTASRSIAQGNTPQA